MQGQSFLRVRPMRRSIVPLAIAACGRGETELAQREAKAGVATASPTQTTSAPSFPRISVSSDPRPEYFLVELTGPKNARVIVSKRIGSSGTSYAKRLVDCTNMSFKYLGEGNTLEILRSSRSSHSATVVRPWLRPDGTAVPYPS